VHGLIENFPESATPSQSPKWTKFDRNTLFHETRQQKNGSVVMGQMLKGINAP
jgi:hypothetical protein